MIDIQLLNSDAQLNNYQSLSGISYIPGSDLTIVAQLRLSQLGIRYIPPVGVMVEFTFKTRSGTDLVLPAVELDPMDRSIYKLVLTPAQTIEIVGSNFVVTVTDGTAISKGLAQNVLARNIIDGDC